MNKIVQVSSKDKNILIRSGLLAAMDEHSAMSFMEAASIVTLPARHMLFTETDPAEHLYYVLSGYVRLFRTGRDGREADIRICAPGESFNDCMIFGGSRNRYSAQAAEGCILAKVELTRIRSMVETDLAVARAVIESLSKSSLTALDCIANDRLQTAPQRVAHYLARHAPSSTTPCSFRLPFQKSVLAGKLGLAPEALSRAFSALRSAGVSVRGRVIHISDPSALSRI